MEWTKPAYSKGQVDKAGKILTSRAPVSLQEESNALGIVNNWRAAHNFPLNTFQVTLRRKAADIDPTRLIAQRIKRMTSIEMKLERFRGMRMTQMQDIGGCRAIMSSIATVNKLVDRYKNSDLKHKLDDIDDYINCPKPSGYRGIHMIYKYYSDRDGPAVFNGLFIEMQLRTRLQHTWATAVETVGTFLEQALKSSMGEEKWLRFFALMSSSFAIKEKCSVMVPGTPNNKLLLAEEIRHFENELQVSTVLTMYQQAISVAKDGARKGDHYYLLVLEPSKQQMSVHGFKRSQIIQASQMYLDVEESIANTPGSEAVLVSVDSINSLERAYPNYFLDTTMFLRELQSIVG